MALSKNAKRYLIFYSVVVLVIGGFLIARFTYLFGDIAPGETRRFQASVFVNKLSENYTVEAPEFLAVKVVNMQNFGFFVEYQRQPRSTFDFEITAAPEATPGEYDIAIKFAEDYIYRDRISVRRVLFGPPS
ncbi:MAG: hypothetical protein ACTSXZ_02980 [Alphaproteobacteria bacterium]